jgi:hypothetical protein
VSRSKRLGLGAAHERLWEPPEGGGLLDELQLIDALVLGFLVADVSADRGFVSPYGRDEVAACPEVLPDEASDP